MTFIDTATIRLLGAKLDNFKYPNSEKLYGVDAYLIEVYPANHKEEYKFISDQAYWMERFTKTRRVRGNKLSKGFLEIIY